jgi:hypothetical protein
MGHKTKRSATVSEKKDSRPDNYRKAVHEVKGKIPGVFNMAKWLLGFSSKNLSELTPAEWTDLLRQASVFAYDGEGPLPRKADRPPDNFDLQMMQEWLRVILPAMREGNQIRLEPLPEDWVASMTYIDGRVVKTLPQVIFPGRPSLPRDSRPGPPLVTPNASNQGIPWSEPSSLSMAGYRERWRGSDAASVRPRWPETTALSRVSRRVLADSTDDVPGGGESRLPDESRAALL